MVEADMDKPFFKVHVPYNYALVARSISELQDIINRETSVINVISRCDGDADVDFYVYSDNDAEELYRWLYECYYDSAALRHQIIYDMYQFDNADFARWITTNIT